MSDISLSKAVRSNLLSLQGTAELMANTQKRLATGNKVNSALDNPSNWFTAQGLNNRAGDLNALMDSMANGIQTLKAADNGLTAMTKTLESMQSTLRQARQDKSFQTQSFEPATSLSGGTAIGKMTFKGGAVGDIAREIEVNKARAVTTATNNYAPLDLNTAVAPAFTAAADKVYTFNVNGGGAQTVNMRALSTTSIEVQVGSNKYSVDVASADAVTKDELAAGLNKAFQAEKMGLSVDSSGAKLVFTADKDKAVANGTQSLVLGGADVANLGGVPATDVKTIKTEAKTTDEIVDEINTKPTLKGFIRASNDNGKLRIENLSTQPLDIVGASATAGVTGVITASGPKATIAGNSVREGLSSQFNELRDQLDKLADDASFNGINLLRGDKLTITFNETGTSAIDIQTDGGQTVNTKNLGVPTSMTPQMLDSDVSIDSLLGDMKSALDEVRSQASTFGSNLSIVQNRQTFTKQMIDTLETGAGNLTLADMNEEAANLLALQTRQQLSSNSLSLASQADQSVLQLLQ